jgi:hypothetical protein
VLLTGGRRVGGREWARVGGRTPWLEAYGAPWCLLGRKTLADLAWQVSAVYEAEQPSSSSHPVPAPLAGGAAPMTVRLAEPDRERIDRKRKVEAASVEEQGDPAEDQRQVSTATSAQHWHSRITAEALAQHTHSTCPCLCARRASPFSAVQRGTPLPFPPSPKLPPPPLPFLPN